MADPRLSTILSEFGGAVSKAFDESREMRGKMQRLGQQYKGESEDIPRIDQMFATHPVVYGVRDLMGKSDPAYRLAREDLGMGLEKGKVRKAGQLVGRVASDLTEDVSRSVWWLLNAAQASGAVIAEKTLHKALPELKGTSLMKTEEGLPIGVKNAKAAKRANIILDELQPYKTRRNYKVNDDGFYEKADYSGTMKNLAMVAPSGIAINSAIGLLTPMGGAEGFKAVYPSEEDPNKTDNAVLEVATKYFLGRKGNILPYDEFKQVRPDVSREQYNAYKAHKYDKRVDLNPFDDGSVVLPLGIAKATTNGVQGPEVELLGSTIPLTTGGVPFASSLAGGIIGGRMGRKNKTVAGKATIGGMAGLGVGMVAGNLLEAERRRRNEQANFG